MGAAARLGDTTSHGGTVTGPGAPTVLIGGMPACVALDLHTCSLPPNAHQPTVSPFPVGSPTVLIAGKPAIRAGDACGCGASVIVGEPTVIIGQMKEKSTGFLGTGWHFPPTFDKYSNTLAMVSDEADIIESIGILLSTTPGERVMLESYGADMNRLIFEPMNTQLTTTMENLISDAIIFHEPRILLEKVTLTAIAEEGKIDIHVEYTVVTTNTRYNNVFPYYLNEANNL